MVYEYNNKILTLKAISDIYVYLTDIATDSVQRVFITEVEKLKKIDFCYWNYEMKKLI